MVLREHNKSEGGGGGGGGYIHKANADDGSFDERGWRIVKGGAGAVVMS